ncbi:TatD DNase family protein [Nematocida homosporus]|uniref:TatD DNase family protein n=1 Tax=Nematocida homosporus TaxID=1912981 RepID=UPI002220021B|nr:TatD DNase family protein [Nematocida homosporus]KAI5185779.1 TatD DNase family protein [Nematocida homosporus]
MVFDIAVNITDNQYLGEYYQKTKHICDIPQVVERARAKEIQMVFLGTSLSTSIESIYLAEQYDQFATIGIHPGSTTECTPKDILAIQQLLTGTSPKTYTHLLRDQVQSIVTSTNPTSQRIIAIGEVGLDYFRDYSPRETQREVFQAMLELSKLSPLPYLLHYRDCQDDFLDLISNYQIRGVVHSFTGTLEEMHVLTSKGFYIGINGASIRENPETKVIEELDLTRLLVETDAPWCSIRKTSPYYNSTQEYLPAKKTWSPELGYKGRNEPLNLYQVIDIIASIKEVSPAEIIQITNQNFNNLFQPPTTI